MNLKRFTVSTATTAAIYLLSAPAMSQDIESTRRTSTSLFSKPTGELELHNYYQFDRTDGNVKAVNENRIRSNTYFKIGDKIDNRLRIEIRRDSDETDQSYAAKVRPRFRTRYTLVKNSFMKLRPYGEYFGSWIPKDNHKDYQLYAGVALDLFTSEMNVGIGTLGLELGTDVSTVKNSKKRDATIRNSGKYRSAEGFSLTALNDDGVIEEGNTALGYEMWNSYFVNFKPTTVKGLKFSAFAFHGNFFDPTYDVTDEGKKQNEEYSASFRYIEQHFEVSYALTDSLTVANDYQLWFDGFYQKSQEKSDINLTYLSYSY